jgi:hypothetical protein
MQNEEIEQKDKIISKYQKSKSNLLTDIENMQHKLSGKPYLIGATHIIWDEIIAEVGKIWHYFKIIDEEIILIDEANETINKAFQGLGMRPQVATIIIKFLNTNSREILKIKGVKNKTTMVMETENIFTKINLIQ